MLRKLIFAALLFALLPVNAWAISTVNYSLGGYTHGPLIKNFWSNGSLSGDWNGMGLSNISGFLSGAGNKSVIITGGSVASNGAGYLDLGITSGNNFYDGTISFYSDGWGYDNSVSDTYLNLWGGSWLSHTRNGNTKWPKWVGIDLWGPGTGTVEVPEPATFALMGLGLLGLGFTRKKKSI